MLFLAAKRSAVFSVSTSLGRALANVDLCHLPPFPWGGGEQSGGFITELSAALARLAVSVFAFLSVAIDHRHLPVCMQRPVAWPLKKSSGLGPKRRCSMVVVRARGFHSCARGLKEGRRWGGSVRLRVFCGEMPQPSVA
ncbi:unnamed protein product [Ectocarpus sp. 12 AP-2014]